MEKCIFMVKQWLWPWSTTKKILPKNTLINLNTKMKGKSFGLKLPNIISSKKER
jgi:hypothetical protein